MPSTTLAIDRALAWRDLVREEPALAELEGDIRRVNAGEGFCASAVWYGYPDHEPGFKRRLLLLVGWHAKNPRLRTARAYDLAYDRLYHLLPDCRHEGPLC